MRSWQPPAKTYTYELTGQHGGADTFNRSSVPDAAPGSEGLVWVGGWGDTYIGKMKFSVWGLPKVCGADKVKLKVYSAPSVSPGRTPVNMKVYPNAQDFDQATDTWNNGQPVDAAVFVNVPAPAYGSWVLIDVTTIYKSWQDGTRANYGLAFVPDSTNNDFTFFASTENSNKSWRPKLVITKSGLCL